MNEITKAFDKEAKEHDIDWYKTDTRDTMISQVDKLVNTFNVPLDDALRVVFSVFFATRGEYGD